VKSRRDKSKPDAKAGRTGSRVPPGAGATLSRGRKWAFRLIALLFLPFFLVVLEIALRLGGCGYSARLFKPVRIGNEDYLVQNDDFSLRFFPREAARHPGVLRMKLRKPPGSFRIFILGESAAMGDPEPAYGAGRYLEILLREKYPGTNFEVENVAFTAINSHVILPIARECADQDGDAWIIYMGNNEMVGPFGAATVFGAQAPPRFYVQLVTGIQRTRVGQWLAAAMRKFHRDSATPTSWAGMQMFLDNRVVPGSRKKEMVYRNFEENLEDIVRAGLGHHAKIILNTVAVNLKDTAPFASMASSNLTAVDREEFERLIGQARDRESNGHFAEASGLYAEAVKLDETFADAHYDLGQCLLKMNENGPARDQLQRACDNDALPFRADSRINAIIRAVANKSPGENLVLFDAANALASNNSSGLCGNETFYEHVHFDFDGNYRLGLDWADQIAPMLPAAIASRARQPAWASQAECERLLGLSNWNRALVLEHMSGRFTLPPFSSQSNSAGRIETLQSRARQLRARAGTNEAAEARQNFADELERWPADFLLRENFALFLQATGDLTNAIAQWHVVHGLIPHDYLPWFQLGRLLGGQAQWTDSETDLREAVKIHPTLTEGWLELGNVLASQKKFSEALSAYSTARKQRPQDAVTVFRIAKVYASMDQHDSAVQFYREASKLNPTDWEPHYELGGELDSKGQLDEACRQFGEAARLNPGNSRTHFNHGVLLAKLGRLDDAQNEFEETSRLEPGYQGAQENLAKIRLLKERAGRH
jgi:tetratricopeptide (TPR) repeat protein